MFVPTAVNESECMNISYVIICHLSDWHAIPSHKINTCSYIDKPNDVSLAVIDNLCATNSADGRHIKGSRCFDDATRFQFNATTCANVTLKYTLKLFFRHTEHRIPLESKLLL